MSQDAELESFIAVVHQQLAAGHGGGGSSADEVEPLLSALNGVGAIDLALDTLELENALEWLSAVVRACAHHSPSIAFGLAARYVANRATHDSNEPAAAAAVAATDGTSPWQATVPAVFAPRSIVLIRRLEIAASVVPWEEVQEECLARTGLPGADLRTVTAHLPSDAQQLSEEQARVVLRELDLLNASVGVGLLERAVATSEAYGTSRHQFGQPIASFAGLAAILVDMRLRSSIVSGMLATALDGALDGAELLAVTGRACVDACLDAIQVHGGYGYIDEYPVAGMLRDALSLRARGGGRRAAVASVAAAHLPSA